MSLGLLQCWASNVRGPWGSLTPETVRIECHLPGPKLSDAILAAAKAKIEADDFGAQVRQLSRDGFFISTMFKKQKLLHFEWSPPWHHIETYLSQILTFFVLTSGEDEKETIILMKSRALRSLDFIRIILSSSSLLLVRGPAVTTVIYQAKLIQTDSRCAWFKTISDARASPVA